MCKQRFFIRFRCDHSVATEGIYRIADRHTFHSSLHACMKSHHVVKGNPHAAKIS